MSSGCGDVLSLEDLKTAKLHQTFEAEVITGKYGGVATGGNIDYATNAVTGQVQKTMPAILRDVGFEPASFDFQSGGTLTVNDRNKAVLWPSASGGDGFWYYWEGALPKVIPAASSPSTTGGVAEGAWRPLGDVTLRDDLAASSGANQIGYGVTTVGGQLDTISGPSGADEVGYGPSSVGGKLDSLSSATGATQIGYGTITVDEKLNQLDARPNPSFTFPPDLLLFSSFRSQQDIGIHFSKSMYGNKFETINDALPRVSQSTDYVQGRDSSIVWFNGFWYMAVTWYNLGVYDARIYRSDNLEVWDSIFVTLGASAVGSNTTPAPGATHPCNQLWAPQLFVYNDELYMGVSLPFGADFVDVNGTTVPDFRQYLSKCTNIANLTFSAPVLISQTANTRCQIDGAYYRINGSWHLLTKNDYNKDIEDWTSTSLYGPYTKNAVIIPGTTRQSEGPALVRMSGSDPEFLVFTDDYVNGTYLVTKSNDFVSWAAPVEVQTDRNTRHGDVINVGSLPLDAKLSYLAYQSGGSKSGVEAEKVLLNSSNASFSPRDGQTYYITGTTAIDLTISELSAKQFFIVFATAQPTARITLKQSAYFDGPGGDFVISGSGSYNRRITVNRFGNKFMIG